MGKHRNKEEWIYLFRLYEKFNEIPKEYFERLDLSRVSKASRKRDRTPIAKLRNARSLFINKYKSWKLLDNSFMNKPETRGRKPTNQRKKDIENFVSELTREQLEELARIHIESEDKKKNKDKHNTYSGFSTKEKSFIMNVHRTTLYKKKKERIYKFDWAKKEVFDIFHGNKGIYGSLRISKELVKQGIAISPRTLRNYMSRWGLVTKTRVAKRKQEHKNTQVKYKDLVKRNFNPSQDNIVATDVSYIPTKTNQNFSYLSVVISHKTKMIEAWELSLVNDTRLVVETLKKLDRTNFLLHSDHGSQYSASEVQDLLRDIKGKTSMGRVGNSLDNREVEYFFGCLKGEYLNHLKTHSMSINEVKEHIRWYINWYNTKRIQKRLHWLAPESYSQMQSNV